MMCRANPDIHFLHHNESVLIVSFYVVSIEIDGNREYECICNYVFFKYKMNSKICKLD